MNSKLITAALFAAAIAALSQVASAQSTPRVDARQAKQDARIQQGVASGELNNKELNRLENGQARVEAAEAKAKADGKVTKKERAVLHAKQNKQSARIYRQKHDAQKAPAAAGK
jgi:hypothetical protein